MSNLNLNFKLEPFTNISDPPADLPYTGPPDTTLPLYGVLKSPGQLGSSKTGSMDAINKNMGAIGYYFDAMGCANDFKGYGIRAVYDTKIKCSNKENATAHRYIDGTASLLPAVVRNQLGAGGNCGGYGVIPRFISVLTDLDPQSLTDSAKTETECEFRRVHINTESEIKGLRERGGQAIPASNRVDILTNGKVDYTKMDSLCQNGTLRNCVEVPLEKDVVEGFGVSSTTSAAAYISEYQSVLLVAIIIASIIGFYATKSKVIRILILIVFFSGITWNYTHSNSNSIHLIEFLAMLVFAGLLLQWLYFQTYRL
jgi:hypothetical protein